MAVGSSTSTFFGQLLRPTCCQMYCPALLWITPAREEDSGVWAALSLHISRPVSAPSRRHFGTAAKQQKMTREAAVTSDNSNLIRVG